MVTDFGGPPRADVHDFEPFRGGRVPFSSMIEEITVEVRLWCKCPFPKSKVSRELLVCDAWFETSVLSFRCLVQEFFTSQSPLRRWCVRGMFHVPVEVPQSSRRTTESV